MTIFVGESHCPSTSWEIPDLKKNRIILAENEKGLHRWYSNDGVYIKSTKFRFSPEVSWLKIRIRINYTEENNTKNFNMNKVTAISINYFLLQIFIKWNCHTYFIIGALLSTRNNNYFNIIAYREFLFFSSSLPYAY